MSAAPEVQPGYDDPLLQVAEDVDALRRRLDDQAALLRRSQASLTQLAESVGKVVEGQRRRERRAILNSFVAYILFTVLLGGGALLLYRSRAADLERARRDAVTDLDAARKELASVRAELLARDDAAQKAYGFYALLRDGKRGEAVARYVDVAHLALTPTERDVFAAGEKEARSKMVDAGWESGLEAFKKGDFARAVTELRRAENYETGGANAGQMHYYLGVALVKTGDAAGAVDELEAAVAAKVDAPVAAGAGQPPAPSPMADARFYLAAALEGAGKPEAARREYEKFAAAQPLAPLAPTARQKWVALGQQLAAKKVAPR